MRTFVNALIILILVSSLTACIGRNSHTYRQDWAYADLRLLDPVDAFQPHQDLLAVYVRDISVPVKPFLPTNFYQNNWQLRLDLLDLDAFHDQDIYLAIDFTPGGIRKLPISTDAEISWDSLVVIPSHGEITSRDPTGDFQLDMAINLLRDPSQDTLTLNFKSPGKLGIKGSTFRAQIFVTPAGSLETSDQTRAFNSDGEPPQPTRVLFAFWNAFPAYTPAQALRRWDGAHTGPLGGRHGLFNLLRAARNYRVPLALLDLKSPESLSALDYAQGTDFLLSLVDNGLLILPEFIPVNLADPAIRRFARETYQSALDFGLGTSHFLYAPLSSELPGNYPVIFSPAVSSIKDDDHPLTWTVPNRWRGSTIISIPGSMPSEQATLDGITLDVRRTLIDTAWQAHRNQSSGIPLLVLGGDLTQSTWGEPQRARAGFDYLLNHPWIELVDAMDLLSWESVARLQVEFITDRPAHDPLYDELLQDLLNSPRGTLNQAAWEAYRSFYAPFPDSSPAYQALQNHYLGQIGVLLAAAYWEANPIPIADCQRDIDYDRQFECVLATESLFTAYDIDTGALTHAFVHTSTGVHQMIGPSSQFVVGLSDPGSWDLGRGSLADPSVISGALSDTYGPYKAILESTQVTFESPEIKKVYQITTNGVQVKYQVINPVIWKIPLVIDPWTRFSPDWGERYRLTNTGTSWEWSINDGVSIRASSSSPFTTQVFTESKELMGRTENPNYEYPAGHYLPFPIAVLELSANGQGSLEISPAPE